MIAVDAMGGDYAPEQVVLGALLAAKGGIPVALFGFQEQLCSLLFSHDIHWKTYPIKIFNVTQQVAMSESPVVAVRRKPDSSLVRAIRSVKDGVCAAMVSAGNTGAVAVASMFVLKMQSGVSRPALAGVLQTKKDPVLFLDIGANADCKAEHLVQFAQMADAYSKRVLLQKRPAIGLLANGHEEGKGSLLVKNVHVLLKKDEKLNFIGNIEPDAVLAGEADVVVTDGFSGNIFIKTVEALVNVFGVTNYEIARSGALLLGVNGCVVVSHGNADAHVIKNAISFAHKSSYNRERLYGTQKESFRGVST